MSTFKRMLPVVALVFAGISTMSAAWSEADGVYYLKTGDGLEQFTVDGTITFKSQSGSTIAGFRDCGVVFTPANPGEVIQIKVENNDLSDPNYLLLYDKEITKIGSNTSDGKDQSHYLPSGWVEKYTADNVGSIYTSTNPEGKISFGFHSGSANNQKGFTITVSSVSTKDMEYVGAETVNVQSSWRGRTDAPLTDARIKTNGGGNPLVLNTLTYDISGLSALGITDFKVYNGSIKPANLIATAEPGATTLSISDLTLKAGKNDFILAGNLPVDLTGVIPEATVTATVGGQERTFTSAAAANEVLPEVRISTDASTYTINDAVNFYDDGGKDGKISEHFTGTVTFVPATEGMAIKADFTKMKIFSTSTTGLNDVLTVYNGRTADEANLITTLLKEVKVVKSSAEDGSLTVKLVSTTGVPADGWEAVISQFKPGNMVLSGITGTVKDADKTISSMQKDVVLATVDVLTDNTTNPLNVERFSFTGTNTGLLSNLQVYYLGIESAYNSGKQLFAEIPAPGQEFTISGSQSLREGHNYFVIVGNMGSSALNNDHITLKLNNVSVSGNDTEVTDVNIDRAIKNTVSSSPQAQTINMLDSWEFLPTYNPAVTYAKKYDVGMVDQVTTFIPAVEGGVAQLDITKFDLYRDAKFAVYSGRGIDKSNLLWESSSSTLTTGPGRSLRSVAEDGSMTVVFNPNTSYSYACNEGWVASVKPFVNHDMTITNVTASRPATPIVAPGAANCKMLNFAVECEGTLSVKNIKEINLSVAGHEALSSISVYASTEDNRESATLFGSTANPTGNTVVAGNRDMVESANYFWVEANVNDNAAADTEIKIGVASLKDADGNVDIVENGNPEGSTVVKNVILLEEGTHVYNVGTDMTWYDDGGADGNISPKINATYTFVPTDPDNTITLDATQFSIGNGRIYVYSGREVNDSKILGTVTGYSTTNGPANLRSTAEDGSMTVTVKSPTSATSLAGFTMTVGLHRKADFTLSDLATAPATDATGIMRGSSDQPLAMVKASVNGDKNDALLSDMTFDIAGADNISGLHLYYMGDVNRYAEAIATKVGDATAASSVSFATPTDISGEGDHYFFLTADIKPEAAAGQNITATLASANFNSEVAATSGQGVTRTINAGLKGDFTVGAGGDYANLAAATQVLAAGVEGAVTFNILPGTYAENLVIENVPGASATAPVTFRGHGVNNSEVNLTGMYTANEKNGIIRIVGTPYVTIENLSANPGTAQFSNVVYVADGSTHTTIRGNAFTAQSSTSYSDGKYLIYCHALNEAGGNNDYLTVENNTLTGGRIATNFGGTSYVALPMEKGLRVVGNTITNAGSKGIYVTNGVDAYIHGNTVTTASATKNYNGMDLSRLVGGEVSANRVINNGNESTYAISVRSDCHGSADVPLRIFNNDAVVTAGKDVYTRTLLLGNGVHDIDIAFNTFRAAGLAAYTFATSGTGATSNINVHDNIITNVCTTSGNAQCAVMFWNSTDAAGFTFERNDVYSPNTEAIAKNDTEGLSIDGLNALFSTTTNISVLPDFASTSDSHLVSADGLTGLPAEGIRIDLEGNTRSASAPTLGAYEYSVISTDAPEMSEGYPRISDITVNSAVSTARWNMNGLQYTLVRKATEDAPLATTLKSQTGVDISADTEIVTTLSNLDPSTEYRVYYLAVSSVGTESEIVASAPFTTAREILPLVIDTDEIETEVISAGDELTLSPVINGGDRPYSYTWTAQDGTPAGNGATVTVSPSVSQRYLLKVTSADGQSAEAYFPVEVLGRQAVAEFDDNYIADGTSLYPAKGTAKFYSGSYGFNYMSAKMMGQDFWCGYILSNDSESAFATLSDQFRSAPGGGYQSDNFCVAYPQGMKIEVTNSEEGEIIAGTYITNSAYAYNSMIAGDGYSQPFGQDSWFKVTAKGTAADGSTSTLDFYLGDYRNTNAAEHYVLNTWEWLDLRPLGRIKSLTFTFDGSDKGQFGLNTPSYLCLDHFGALPVMESYDVAIPDGESVDLSTYFTGAADGSVPSYFISSLDGQALPLTLDGTFLSVDTDSTDPIAVMAGMTQRGHSQYVQLNVSREIGNSITETYGNNDVRIYTAAEILTVKTSLTGYSVEVFSADGKRIHHSSGHDGDCVIRLGGLNTGIYIVKVTNNECSKTFRQYLR